MARYGRHKLPFYRVVAVDSRVARDGAYIEQIGTFDPLKDLVQLNEEAALKWLKLGALPTDTVKNMLKEKGIYAKFLNEKKQSGK